MNLFQSIGNFNMKHQRKYALWMFVFPLTSFSNLFSLVSELYLRCPHHPLRALLKFRGVMFLQATHTLLSLIISSLKSLLSSAHTYEETIADEKFQGYYLVHHEEFLQQLFINFPCHSCRNYMKVHNLQKSQSFIYCHCVSRTQAVFIFLQYSY